MKIILVITDFGSFNNFLSDLAVAMSEKKIEVHIICSIQSVIKTGDNFDYNKYNIVFHFIDIPRTLNLVDLIKSSIKIRKIIKTVNPDLVHSHFTTGTFPTVLLKRRKIEYWGTFHGLGMNASSGLRKILFTIIESFCFIKLNKIFLVNNEDLNLLKKNYKNKSAKYQSYGFGCNIDRFNKIRFNQIDLIEFAKRFNIEGRFVITFIGRFVEFKGFDLVFHSFKKLNQMHPGVFSLLLIGGPDPIHSSGLEESEVNEIESNPDIINVGYSSEVEKYLAISNVYLFPSKKEGLPTCIVEALSMGLPIITSNVRGCSDIIFSDYNGILIETESKKLEVENIIEAILNLYFNPQLASTFSNNALKDRNKYSRTSFINEHLNMYFDFLTIKRKNTTLKLQ